MAGKKRMTPQQRQQELDSINKDIRGDNDYSLRGREKLINNLKKEIDDPSTTPEQKEQKRKAIDKLWKEWDAKHAEIMKRVKQLAREGGDLLSHLMNVLAAQLTSWRNKAHRGLLDYLWDPIGTYKTRTHTQQKDAEAGFEKRKERQGTLFGAAITGVGMVTSTILGGVGLMGKTLGKGADYVGNSAREMGSKLVANAKKPTDENASMPYRAGQFLAGGAMTFAGGVAHLVGAAPKIAGMALSGTAGAVNAASDYATGRREYLLGESNYTDAIGSTLDQARDAANEAFADIKSFRSVQNHDDEELEADLEERHANLQDGDRPSLS